MPQDPKLKGISGSGTPMWYAGFIIFTIGNILNFASFSLAAQSLLAGLGSIQFITNVAFSYFMLKARITWKIITGTIIILVGNTFLVIFASQQSRKYDIDQMMRLYISKQYGTYIIILFLAIIVLLSLYYWCEDRIRNFGILKYRVHRALAIPSSIYRLHAVSYAMVSAIIGTQSVILAKSCSDLLRSTIEGDNQFYNPFTYLLLALWIFTIVFWLKRMNSALQRFDGVFIIPFLQVNWIVFSIVGGGLYFKEFNEFSSTQVSMFCFGVLLILTGVTLLAPSKSHKKTRLTRRKTPASEALETSYHFEIVHRPNFTEQDHPEELSGDRDEFDDENFTMILTKGRGCSDSVSHRGSFGVRIIPGNASKSERIESPSQREDWVKLNLGIPLSHNDLAHSGDENSERESEFEERVQTVVSVVPEEHPRNDG